MASLRITSPEGTERVVELDRSNTLGRHPDNSIQLLDRIVSKNHCTVERTDTGYVLSDLGSLNGTYVNGERVDGKRTLRGGDDIVLGSTRMRFETGSDAPASAGGLPGGAGAAQGKVTMAPGMVESHVRARLSQQGEQNFVPERLIDEPAVRRDYEKLRASYDLTRAIAGELDVDRLLEKILTTAFELLSADRGVVLLLDDGQRLQPRCVRTRREGLGEEVALSNTIIGEVLRDRSAVLSSDALMDARFKGAQSIIMQGIRSSMAVPLVYSNELLGVMVLDSQVAANAFTEKDLQITQAIANQAAVAIQNSLYAKKIEREALTRSRFQRLLSPAIAELVVSGEVEVEKGGRSLDTTVFFSDIRGFTAMSERRSAQQIVDMLNEYFEMMVEVIFRHEGTLDKFVGDEIIALFGAPMAMPNAELKAVECALDMAKVLKDFNRTRAAEGLNEIKIGIGINTGTVVTGAIGSSRALQYTAIGDAVNTAARLCSIAKPDQIILSEYTYRKVKDQVDAVTLSPVRLKGKTDELRIYNAVGLRSTEWHDDHTKPM